MLPQRYAMYQFTLVDDYYGAGENDELLTYLPLCHVAERIFSGWLPIYSNATIYFA